MHRNLPVYLLSIPEDSEQGGFTFTALVKDPAIEIPGFNGKFVAFDKQLPVKFNISNEDKRIVSGPLVLADVPIYRKDEDGTEYYVVMNSQSTLNILQKLFRDEKTKAVNIQHDKAVTGLYMFEAFLIDRHRMPPPVGYETLTDGSIFVSYKVTDDTIWNEIKAGTFQGFSFEGNLFPEKVDLQMTSEALLLKRIEEIVVQG